MLKFLTIWTLLGCFSSLSWGQDLSSFSRKKSAPKVAKPTPKAQSEEKTIKSFIFNLGTHTEFYGSVQLDDSGNTRKFDYKSPTIGFGVEVPLKNNWSFLPEINWVLPKQEAERVIKNLFMYRADFGYDPLDWLRLRVGTSIMHGNQHGQGGEVNMNNGNATSTFYYPDENRSSLNNTLDFGLEGRHDEWSLRLQTYIYSVFVEERREISYTLFVSYYWDR